MDHTAIALIREHISDQRERECEDKSVGETVDE